MTPFTPRSNALDEIADRVRACEPARELHLPGDGPLGRVGDAIEGLRDALADKRL